MEGIVGENFVCKNIIVELLIFKIYWFNLYSIFYIEWRLWIIILSYKMEYRWKLKLLLINSNVFLKFYHFFSTNFRISNKILNLSF